MTTDDIPRGYTTVGRAREEAQERFDDLRRAVLRRIEADPSIPDEVKTEVRLRVDAAYDEAMELFDQKLDQAVASKAS